MKSTSQFNLLTSGRFGPFFCTQFLGAFNDNTFKNALIILITYQAASWSQWSADTLVNICAGLFILPFFIFSASAGQLADKYEKSKLIRYIKALEILIMFAAALGFYLHNIIFLLAVLFLLGAQSTFFGPVKYSILPQHLLETELVGGNGLVEMGTFVAIILGTLFGGILISIDHWGPLVVSITTIIVAVIGLGCSWFIPKAAPVDPSLRLSLDPIRQTWKCLKLAKKNRTVFLSILGISWFWLFGAVFLTQIPLYSKSYLGGSEIIVTILLLMFCVGVGFGSLLCEKLSGFKIEIGLVPFGSFGLSIFAIIIYYLQPTASEFEYASLSAFLHNYHNWWILLNIALLGTFGGFYIVPLYALIQHRSEETHRSRIIAANNILNALFMVIAAVYAIVLLKLNFSVPQLFLITGILNMGVAIYIFDLVPEFLMRFITWIVVSILYRVKVENVEESIPDKGPAVVICNHVSFVDPLVMMACVRRPMRFIMDHNIFKIPFLSFVFRTGRAIPIAPAKEDNELKEKAFLEVARALRNGELVAIFPEGGITRSGELERFRPGLERIISETPVPIIPMAISGLWGSFFSRKYGRAMSSIPRKLRAKISLRACKPVAPEDLDLKKLEATVLRLRGMEK